jgi:hypothetical protein
MILEHGLLKSTFIGLRDAFGPPSIRNMFS